MIWNVVSDKVLEFVSIRRKEQGGYGATPLLPATVEDTYYALRILKLLKGICGVAEDYLYWEALERYLLRELQKGRSSARTTYRLIWSLKTCCHEIKSNYLFDFIKKQSKKNLDENELHYLVRIKREFFKEPFRLRIQNPNFELTTVNKLWIWLYMYNDSLSNQKRRYCIEWLRRCQNPDGGFGFHPGSTSYVENTHLALRCLYFLDAKPQYLDLARDFLMACRTSSGGFSRIHGGVAFMDSTWHALSGLLVLQRQKKHLSRT